MGLDSAEVPPYASWAMFELHRISDDWQVKFTYNGEVEPLSFCEDARVGDYCPLDAYERYEARALQRCASIADSQQRLQSPCARRPRRRVRTGLP